MAKKIRVTLVKSSIGQKRPVCATARSLRLGKLHSVVEHTVSPAILGMVRAVSHLVKTEELD